MVWLKASFLLWTGAFVGGLQLLWVPGCTVAVVVAAGVVHVFCQQFCKMDKKKKSTSSSSSSSNPTIQPLFSVTFRVPHRHRHATVIETSMSFTVNFCRN
jgi:hypothetical protein